MSPLRRRTRGSERPVGLDEAMYVARMVGERRLDHLSDSELEAHLRLSAGPHLDPDGTAAALGAVDVAVRRRLGQWRTLTERLMHHAVPRADDSGHCEPIAQLLNRLRTEHPSDMRLDADFYTELETAAGGDGFRFEPTRQQVAAAALLLRETVVEMDAGEGKTMAAGMASALLAAAGRHVHILTANDYLAARDCETLAPVLESLGITVGLVIDNMDRDERRLQYATDVVFTTAREVGFDYLRDRIATRTDQRVNPRLDAAIVDEADHLLVDQARTPLIISGDPITEASVDEETEVIAEEIVDLQTNLIEDLYARLRCSDSDSRVLLASIMIAGGLTPRLVEALDRMGRAAREVFADVLEFNDSEDGSPLERDLLFTVDADRRLLRLTEQGWGFIFDRTNSPRLAHEVAQMLQARVVHDSGTDYVVSEEAVTLVDQLDGRPMHSHRYMHGLHEALESKEGLEGDSRAHARAMTTVHALMSMYSTVAGLTGTAVEEADTLMRDYGVGAVRVPPESPSRRVDLGAEVYFDREEHLRSVVDEVVGWHRLGRPLLLAVGSVGESERFSQALSSRDVPHNLLNAANPAAESEIVEVAGESGAVTVSTGMAGRGTDIVVADDVDTRLLSRAADLARKLLGRYATVDFACATREEAFALNEGLSSDLEVQVSLRRQIGNWRVSVAGGPTERVGTVRMEFGLGLMVILASVPASARVERQIRGRTGRQGRFGASRLSAYINDPILAFARQQRGLFRMCSPAQKSVVGAEVARLLREAQSERESRSAAVASATSEFAAVIESESRAHYGLREELMGPEPPSGLVDRAVRGWVERHTAELDEIQTDYQTRFALVSDGLWHHYGIDIGPSDGLSPVEVRQVVIDEVRLRMALHQDRIGAKRFTLTFAAACLGAADDLWPGRLVELQDMALSTRLGGLPQSVSLAEFRELSVNSRGEFWATVEDMAISEFIGGGPVAEAGPMMENCVEKLPTELSELLVGQCQ